MTTQLPIHLTPPDVKTARKELIEEMKLPDWGLPFNPKKQEIPSDSEIVAMFDQDEKERISYTASFYVRMLIHFVTGAYGVVFSLKYPKRPEYKKQCRLLTQLCAELKYDSVKAHLPQDAKQLDMAFDKLVREAPVEFKQLDFATSAELLKTKQEPSQLAVAICNALAIIDKINEHGMYTTRVIAEKAGLEAQEFVPSKYVTLVKALLVDMADKFKCEIKTSSDMRLGVEILLKNFLIFKKRVEDEQKDF